MRGATAARDDVLQGRTRPLAELGWLGRLKHAPHFLGYPLPAFVGMLILSSSVTLTEGIGVALMYPIIQLMQSGQSPDSLIRSSVVFRVSAELFSQVHLPFTLSSLMLVAAVTVVVREILTYSATSLRVYFSQRAVEQISSRTFRLFTEANIAYAERIRSGSLTNAVFTEAKRAGMTVLAVQNLVASTLRLVTYAALLLLVSWKATAIGLGALSLAALLLSRRTVRASALTGQQISEANDRLTRHAVEQFGLLRLIKISRTADLEAQRFATSTSKLRQMNVTLGRRAALLNVTIESCIVLGGLSLAYLATTTLNISLGALAVFLVAVLRLMPVAQEMAVSSQQLAGYIASVRALDLINLEAAGACEHDDGKRSFAGMVEGMRFESVSFAYQPVEGDRIVPALRDITLTIPAGRTTALLGPSGAGKSTLMDLIPRLREPTRGRILFDDTPIDEIRLAELRRNIAFVSQDALVLDGTVEENLSYGHPEADRDALIAAAKDAFAHDFIERLPQGYDTVVGERGVLLSGGQKQRLALARALVGQASILLLDEPTSALDAESEQAVQRALARLQASHAMTIVIIAHRLSTVRHADHIVVLEDGRLLGSGTHDELMNTAPWYRRIVQLQLGETPDAAGTRHVAGAN